MRILWTVIGVAMLAACTRSEPENFAGAFERMQSDADFLQARVHPGFRMVETLVRGDTSEPREIVCSFGEIRRSGWHILPAAARLASTGTAYGAPKEVDERTRVVTLGTAQGGADARYRFALSDGTWKLVRVDVYTHLDAGEPAPPLPCVGESAMATPGPGPTPDATRFDRLRERPNVRERRAVSGLST